MDTKKTFEIMIGDVNIDRSVMFFSGYAFWRSMLKKFVQ